MVNRTMPSPKINQDRSIINIRISPTTSPADRPRPITVSSLTAPLLRKARQLPLTLRPIRGISRPNLSEQSHFESHQRADDSHVSMIARRLLVSLFFSHITSIYITSILFTRHRPYRFHYVPLPVHMQF